VDFEDIPTDGSPNESIFRDVNYSRVIAPYTSDFILLDTANTEAVVVVSDPTAIDSILAAEYDPETGVMTRRAREVSLNEVAVETIEGDIVPFSEIIAGRAVNLSPEQYDTLNLYFRSLIGNSAADYGMRFYAPTAFHGAHVLIGVIWALIVLWRGYKGYYDKNAIGLEMFGLYWHFVDVVWIVLFTLIYLI
jgi:hypothetical protein